MWPFFQQQWCDEYILEVIKPENFWRLKPVAWRLKGNLTQTALFLKPEPYTFLGSLQLQILHWWGRHRACDKATVDGQQHPTNSQSIVQIPWDTVLWSAQLVRELIHQQEESCILLTMPARMEDFVTFIGHGTQLDSEEKQPTAPHRSGIHSCTMNSQYKGLLGIHTS